MEGACDAGFSLECACWRRKAVMRLCTYSLCIHARIGPMHLVAWTRAFDLMLTSKPPLMMTRMLTGSESDHTCIHGPAFLKYRVMWPCNPFLEIFSAGLMVPRLKNSNACIGSKLARPEASCWRFEVDLHVASHLLTITGTMQEQLQAA